MTFTTEEKLAEVEREIAARRRIYPNRVHTGRLSAAQAILQLRYMEAIRDDYREQLQKGALAMMDDAYLEGFNIAVAGGRRSDNPYARGWSRIAVLVMPGSISAEWDAGYLQGLKYLAHAERRNRHHANNLQ